MKIKISKKDLEAALSVVNIGVTGGNDIQSHYVFRSQGGELSLYSFNGRLGTSTFANATVEAERDVESFTVEAKRFKQWLHALGGEDVEVSLEQKDTSVRVTGPQGTVTFRSLDPEEFPFWDRIFEGSTRTASIECSRLILALDHVKGYVATKETVMPAMAVTQVQDSAFWATDRNSLTVVTLSGLTNSGLRLHGKDISAVKGFLALNPKEEIEIHEHKRSTFFKREDGSILSVSRPTTAFIDLDRDEIKARQDQKPLHWWRVNVGNFRSALEQITAVSADSDRYLTMAFDEARERMTLSMSSETGDQDTLSIPCSGGRNGDPEIDMPSDGWSVDYQYMKGILSSYKDSEDLDMGLFPPDPNSMESTGLTILRDVHENGDKYVTLIVWLQ